MAPLESAQAFENLKISLWPAFPDAIRQARKGDHRLCRIHSCVIVGDVAASRISEDHFQLFGIGSPNGKT